MSFTVLLTHDAARDLDELYDYIGRHDAPRKADYVLEQIEKTFSQLSESPERGAYPKELLALVFKGILERTKIDPASIDEVIAGCIAQPSDAPNIARVAALKVPTVSSSTAGSNFSLAAKSRMDPASAAIRYYKATAESRTLDVVNPATEAAAEASEYLRAFHMDRIARLLRDEATFVVPDPKMAAVRAFAAAHPAWPSPQSVGIVDGMGVVVLSREN